MKYDDLFKEENIEEYRAIPFWSWNDELEPEELREQIRWMKRQGFGGYFMHARGGLKTEYLGEKWFECINACLDEGEKQNMQSWAYDENGWPSGFVGGKLLSDPENRDRYLTCSFGAFDAAALASYDVSGEELIRVKSGVKSGEEGVEYLNVYEHISVSTADVLNPDVVDQFLKETHEKYKKITGEKFGRLLKGFFTDEPQYFRWDTPYTKMIARYFAEVYNEDILDGLGFLFVEKNGYRAFRYKYWKAMQTLFYTNFSKKVYEWCDKNGVKLTGHFIEEANLRWQMLCCGGIMPNYMYEHIPGIDHLGRNVGTPVAPKQVSSVAAQLGKEKVLTETFALCGWDVTPKELRRIAEWQYVNGVNLMCQHLLPYSEHGQRKRDYPAHFSWANPWVKNEFKPFNDYFAQLGYLLSKSKAIVNVGYFSPVRSLYFDYKRTACDAPNSVDDSYLNNAVKLSAMNLNYHILDETVMARHSRVQGKTLIVGQCAYEYLIFPETLTMDRHTAELFEEFYKNGGKMLFLGGKPQYLESEKHEYAFDSNISLEEIAAAQEVRADDYCTQIQSAYREIDGRKFIYAVNLSEKKSYAINYKGDFTSFERVNLETGEVKTVSTRVELQPYESAVLFCSDKTPEKETRRQTVTLRAPFKITEASDNYLLLDKPRFSFDGVHYGEKTRYMGVFNTLLKQRYKGEVYLKYEFEARHVPRRISFLAEDMHNISCAVNGKEVFFNGCSDFEKKLYRADIAGAVKQGINEIVLKINFYESENVYYVLFGENVTESLKNCLAYDTTIEACYLQGDFGVYSDGGFADGETKGVYLADGFYLGERKTEIADMVKDGYPFFAGHMTLRSTFVSNGEPCVLKLKGRYAVSYVKVNGKQIEKSYFGDEADISAAVKNGENEAEITLYSGNRNLLGPHHYLYGEEPLAVGPDTFELQGSWKNGVSSKERSNYSFVKFGVFDEDKI